MKTMRCIAFNVGLLLVASASYAQQVCELNGEHINPNHGGMTAGKTGIMRCREREGGPLAREQELKNGVFIGIVRYYEKGVLKREHSVNEHSNREGLAREYAATPGATNPLLREATYRNGETVGIVRSWHASGQLRRVSFHSDNGRELAFAEFTSKGQLNELRCGKTAMLAPHADDAAWCGHRGTAGSVTFYSEDGRARGSRMFERGEVRKLETLWSNGKPRQQSETTVAGGVERTYSEAGVKRREVEWVNRGSADEVRRMTTVEREYHDSGTLVRERRFAPSERGVQLQLEQVWFLNGQLREKSEYAAADGKTRQRETRYHDNGQLAYEGSYLLTDRASRLALDNHKSYDANGRLRRERHYDARGRITREREFDEAGSLARDDEVFEDGSRKAYSR